MRRSVVTARTIGGAAALAVVLLLGLLSPASAAETPALMVALGDSYAAGPLIPAQIEPWGCLKSSNNYAHQLAAERGLFLRDATCSGASTKHMWERHNVSPDKELAQYFGYGGGGNPAQFDSLLPETDIVTLQIGGNDIGFGSIATNCGQDALQRKSCRERYQVNGQDTLQQRIADTGPKVRAVLDGIHAIAPNARILVLGYPGIFRIGPTASCPAMGAGESDAQYMRGVQESLNAMIQTEAERTTEAYSDFAEYVDVYGPSAGFTACDTPVLRWVEPIVPVNAAAPVHPNLSGMTAIKDILAARL